MSKFQFDESKDLAAYTKLLQSNLTFNNIVNESRCVTTGLRGTYPVSKRNQWLHDFLEEHLNMKVEYEFRLNQFTYDLRIGNILINYNPNMSHNVSKSYRFLKGHYDDTFQFDEWHHVKQSLNALQHGMFCIHVWEWDAWEPLIVIIKYLLSTEVANASNLKLIEMPIDEALTWSEDKCYHIFEHGDHYAKALALTDDKQNIYELMVFELLDNHTGLDYCYDDVVDFTVTRHVKVKRVAHGTETLIKAFELVSMQEACESCNVDINDVEKASQMFDAVGNNVIMYHDCSKSLIAMNDLPADVHSCDLQTCAHLGKFKADKLMPDHVSYLQLQAFTNANNIDFLYDDDLETIQKKFFCMASQFDESIPNSYPYVLVIDAGQIYILHSFDSSALTNKLHIASSNSSNSSNS